MTPQEQIVITSITNLYHSLLNNQESWDNIVYERLKFFEAAITNADVQEKYNGIKQILAMYGGMGSINDQVFIKATDILKDEVYKQSFKLLRAYWKELGNESYKDDEFKVFPIDTKVKLIPNTIRYFDNNEVPIYTNLDTKESLTIWVIISNQNRDITNMEEYGIYANGIYSKARHSSLEIVGQ